MLVERYHDGTGWCWRIEATGTRACARGAASGWEWCVVGAFPPSLPAWIGTRIAGGAQPGDFLPDIWERYVAHCAVACVDTRSDRAVIAVDPFAIEKVYQWTDGERHLLGTALPTLLRRVSCRRLPLDAEAVTFFFLTGYTPAFHTFHQGVAKLGPGTLTTLGPSGGTSASYLRIPRRPRLSEEEFVRTVQERWESGVSSLASEYRKHVVSLSGGIDSSSLLAAMLRLQVPRDSITARTGVSVDDAGTVFNPFDRAHSARVAEDLGISHQEAHYVWSHDRVGRDLTEAVESQGTEAALGLLLRVVVPEYGDGMAAWAAQNADSILSFTLGGRPSATPQPPFVRGLGGLCGRFNLLGGLDRRPGPISLPVRLLLSAEVRRRCGSQEFGFAERSLGLALHPLKLPIAPAAGEHPHLSRLPEMVAWYLRSYVEHPEVDRLRDENPHAAFLWQFLHGFMQGADNRGTVCTVTDRQLPFFLPWASLGVLRSVADFRPGLRSFWYGKYAALRMARAYEVPRHVMNRVDPPAPELDRVEREGFFLNESVRAVLLPRANEALERFASIVDAEVLARDLDRLRRADLGGADLGLLLRSLWVALLEHLAWGDVSPSGHPLPRPRERATEGV